MADKRKPTPPTNKSVSISGDVANSTVVVGDNNIIQKIINYIFPSEKETLEHRNRRILLGHVENAWIKGVLDASLHGAALLDLGIKEDPEAVTKYPWAIKKESTDETLPAGTSMLEIFDSIGMGRSLLILGAPGSGKTTMLLELARQLIQHAREDVTYPIPMVFNLASWTEKLTLADWLAQELNNLYSVPRKTAPEWVQGNKLLLLLDGLDEVRQDSRAKCVEAINTFRKEHGLTSLAVCSRSQDYADLNAKLSFEGAIEVQPLTQKQITEFFYRFGEEMSGINQVLEHDIVLQEMAETPLFLSIMLLAYQRKQSKEILASKYFDEQRKNLFDVFISQTFNRSSSKLHIPFSKTDTVHYLSWLAKNMNRYSLVSFHIESLQPKWLESKTQIYLFRMLFGLIFGAFIGITIGVFSCIALGFPLGINIGLGSGFISCVLGWLQNDPNIYVVDSLKWSWSEAIIGLRAGLKIALILGLISGVAGVWISDKLLEGFVNLLIVGLLEGLATPISFLLTKGLSFGLSSGQLEKTIYPGQHLSKTLHNTIFLGSIFGLAMIIVLSPFLLVLRSIIGLGTVVIIGLSIGSGLFYGLLSIGNNLLKHVALRIILRGRHLFPWRMLPFLDHCVDLIFLRRVGGGYIFVHRLLMEHFAEMCIETPTSKVN